MRVTRKRLLSLALCAALALGLFVPAGAAEETAVAEVPVEEAGVMPEHDHSHAEAELPAILLAVDPAHAHSFDGGNLTSSFYTFDKGGSAVSTTNKGMPATITTAGGDPLTIDTALKVESKTTITFTAPESGALTIYCGAQSADDIKLDGTSYTFSGGKVTIPTAQGGHTVSRGSGEGHIVYLEWQSAGCETHTWGSDYVTVTEPTCTEPGAKAVTCTVCGAVNPQTEEIPALDHDFAAYVQTTAPTCASAGEETAKCTRCDATDTRAVPATGQHVYQNGKCAVCGVAEGKTPCETHTMGTPTVTPATCTAPGKRVEECSVCGMSVETILPATGHSWGGWQTTTAATCQTEGQETRTCATCGETESRSTGFGEHQFDGSTCTVCGATAGIVAGGWFESLYAEIDGVTDSQVTAVRYTGPMSGFLTGEDLEYLVRDATLSSGKSGVRVDIPGLTPGAYSLEVTAGGKFVASNIQVMAHDRSGFAHYNYTDGVGAYRDDGILKENAIVLYVTDQNKDTVTLTAPDGTTVTGIGHILNTAGSAPKAGGKANNNQGILKKLADNNIPLVVRIVGKVTDPDGTTVFDSVDYGGTEGDQGGMARMKSAKDVTIEGIGADAEMYGWGLHFIAAGDDPAAGRGKSFEVRNITFREVPEDCIGLEGQYENKVFSPVQRGWVHNCAFYPAHISNPAESDKAEGDGSCDFKRGEYFTMSYCYFEGCHKTNLVGSGDSDAAGPQYHITWHHNRWVNCKARGPLSRKANIHIYNCLYENQTDYAMNPRVNTYIFSEYNTFINCKQPRLLTSGGAIKSYMDALGTVISDDAGVNTVTDKSQTVSSANDYANFDTDPDMSYIPSGSYKLDQSTLEARAKIYAYTGPMKTAGDMTTPEAVYASTARQDRLPAAPVALPYDQDINSGYITGDGVKDNVVFSGGTGSASGYKFSKSVTGQNVVFTVKERVNVTVAGTGVALINAESGGAVLRDAGTASDLPAGTYYIQPNNFQPGDQTGAGFVFKDGTVTHLSIEASSKPEHVHSYAATGTVVQAATCSATGLMRYDCTGCDGYRLETIPMTEHNYVGGVCAACGLADGTLGGETGGEVVDVTGLELDAETVNLLQGNTQRVIATVSPANATNRAVSWATSDAAVATVSSNGTITGKGPGGCTVTATAGGFTKTVAVTVTGVSTDTFTFTASDQPAQSQDSNPVAEGTKLGTADFFTVTGVPVWRTKNKSTNKATASLQLGAQQSSGLSFTVPENATARKVTLSFSSTGTSNRSAIGILDANGNLVATSAGARLATVQGTSATDVSYADLPAGTYQIVAPSGVEPADVGLDAFAGGESDPTDPNTRGTRLFSVSVTTVTVTDGGWVAVTGVTLDQTAAELMVGQTLKLTAAVAPADATNQYVTWTTSNSAVATVSAGSVYAKAAGIATITASCGGQSATCVVTVPSAPGGDPVAVTGVTLSQTTAALKVGETVTLTATVAPADATNPAVSWATSNSAVVSVSGGTLTALSAGIATVTATAGGRSATCAVTVTVDQTEETHDLHWVTTKAPTCADTGLESNTCAQCGTVVETRVLPALGHSYGPWSLTRAATCTVDGEEKRVCAVCGAAETETLAATGHDYGAWAVTTQPTCSEEGVRTRYCATCHAAESEDVGTVAHDFGEWAVAVAPTCTEPGQRARICAVGGERDTEEIAPLGHSFENGVCARCQMSEDVAEHDHDWGAGWTALTAATCTTAGVETRACAVSGCGAVERRDVAALGHDYGEWTQTKAPTCTETGTEARVCARCGETERRDVAALGHSYDAQGVCTVCGTAQAGAGVTVAGVTLDKTSASVVKGGTLALTAAVTPADATNQAVTWTSDAPGVATVDDKGVVTAVALGTANITVTTADGGKTAVCTITVISGGTSGGGGGGSSGGGGGGGGGGSSGGSSGGSGGSTTPTTPTTPAAPTFTDVVKDSWYEPGVNYVVNKGLFQGVAQNTFAPELNMTRAMLMTVLARLDGQSTDGGATWYEKGMAWAVAQGVSDGTMGESNVTREQMVTMLYRYAKPAGTGDLTAFVDGESVSDWAMDAIAWAVGQGILTGKDGGRLDPQGTATRAEVATILQRFVEKTGK